MCVLYWIYEWVVNKKKFNFKINFFCGILYVIVYSYFLNLIKKIRKLNKEIIYLLFKWI